MKNKLLPLLLCGALFCASFGGQTVFAESDEPAEEWEEWEDDPAEVTWLMWSVGGTYNEEGLQAVEDALNEITLKKINVEVDLQMLDLGTYMTQMPMQVSAGDKIDLITTFPAGAGSYIAMASAGQLLPLRDLLAENAPELLETVPASVLEVTSINGEYYGIPIYNDYTNDIAINFREAYLTEAGFTKDDIKGFEDIPKVYDAVMALHPEMKMISIATQCLTTAASCQPDGFCFDGLGTDLLAVFPEQDPHKIVSYLESEEFLSIMHVMQDWYAKGYIDRDISTRTTDPTMDPSVFSFYALGNGGRLAGNEALAGEPLVSVKLGTGVVGTGIVGIMDMAIPTSATEPEAAAKLMNLCYTDKELKMLVSYGFEGINYSYAENGGLVVNNSSNYAPNTVGIFGNVLICDSTEADVKVGYNTADVDISKLNYSPVLGFNFDTTPVAAEAAALSAVYNEYKGQIMTGVADDATYEAFIEKLYDNGFQAYIDEAQRQLDEWYASKE